MTEQLQSKLQRTELQLREAQQNILSLRNEAKNHLIEFQCQLQLNQKNNKVLEQSHSKQICALQEQMQRLRLLANQFQRRLSEKEDECNLLENKLSSKRKEHVQLEETIKRLEKEIENTNQENQQYKQSCMETIIEKDDQIAQLKDQLSRLDGSQQSQNALRCKELEAYVQELEDRHKKELYDKSSQLDQIEANLANMRQRFDVLNSEYQSKIRDLEDRFEEQIEEGHKRSIERQQDLQNQLQVHINQLQDQNYKGRIKLKELQGQLARLTGQKDEAVSKLQQELNKANYRIEKLKVFQSKCNQLQKDSQKERKNSVLLTEKEKSFNEKINQLKHEHQRKILEADFDKRKLQEAFHQKQQTCSDLQSQILELKQRIKQLLQETRIQLAQDAQSLPQQGKENRLARKGLLTLEQQLIQIRSQSSSQALQEMNELQTKKDQLTKQVQSLRQQNMRLQEDLSKINQRHRKYKSNSNMHINKIQMEFMAYKLKSQEEKTYVKERHEKDIKDLGDKLFVVNQKNAALLTELEAVKGKRAGFRTYVTNFK